MFCSKGIKRSIRMDVIRYLFLCFIINFSYANITGYYILEKDENNKQAIVEIFKYKDKYYAYALGYSDKSYGKYKNTIFMWNLEQIKQNNFDNGKILNIKNNKIYDIKLVNNKDYLSIKIKIIFGPTLKWKKISNDEFDKYGFIRPDINKMINGFLKVNDE
ncbi:DUF2147 domain-containing protein [Campylobacter peloridis]|uniref:DUF2147 domain-containing protein n=2 Tax=Campylobacter peloridis TaxID=488546 RepID=A0ABX6TYN3_9BACT|nr:DUF2147 domain-containing protein [Campylobacter peloridis]QOQ89164.1 DUF2147 domain-containing protein [Campylobacter peloridis]